MVNARDQIPIAGMFPRQGFYLIRIRLPLVQLFAGLLSWMPASVHVCYISIKSDVDSRNSLSKSLFTLGTPSTSIWIASDVQTVIQPNQMQTRLWWFSSCRIYAVKMLGIQLHIRGNHEKYLTARWFYNRPGGKLLRRCQSNSFKRPYCCDSNPICWFCRQLDAEVSKY